MIEPAPIFTSASTIEYGPTLTLESKLALGLTIAVG